MGYMRHHAVIVTSWKGEALSTAHEKARAIFPNVSNIVEGTANSYQSFFIPPDGSKEGWEESNEGDIRRNKFIEWMDSKRYEDGSSLLEWAELQYGDDMNKSKITRHSDEAKRKKRIK